MMRDIRCDCCGRPWERLPIFTNKDRTYELRLVPFWRPVTPSDEEDIRLMHEYQSDRENAYKKTFERLTQKYGEEKAHEMISHNHTSPNMHRTIECLECVTLDEKDYFLEKEHMLKFPIFVRERYKELNPCRSPDSYLCH
jgi:hypothetical protein